MTHSWNGKHYSSVILGTRVRRSILCVNGMIVQLTLNSYEITTSIIDLPREGPDPSYQGETCVRQELSSGAGISRLCQTPYG